MQEHYAMHEQTGPWNESTENCSFLFFCAPVRFLRLVSPLIYQYYWSYLNFVFDLCSKKQTGNRSANSVTTKTHLATYKQQHYAILLIL